MPSNVLDIRLVAPLFTQIWLYGTISLKLQWNKNEQKIVWFIINSKWKILKLNSMGLNKEMFRLSGFNQKVTIISLYAFLIFIH